ncbi:MAG TPA: nucleoside phosphorylase [Blastocatellia bacterium]|nr:nucleoside phosphorylase [Blastocatellia bacterium]
MTDSGIPILEFDPANDASLDPRLLVERIDMPEHCVVCFFQDVIAELIEVHHARVLAHQRSEIGLHPIYEIDFNGRPVAFFHPGVGAPLAAGLLEEVIARGGRKFIACGGAGVLDREIACGHVVIPVLAVRDEGTSYHYLPPSREVAASPKGVEALERTLKAHKVDYLIGKTWTTDGIYRETRSKIERRRREGCLTVEMEAAAFFAVAQFRDVVFAQLLYGGDDVSGQDWDSRHWEKQSSVREKLFWLAAEACLEL